LAVVGGAELQLHDVKDGGGRVFEEETDPAGTPRRTSDPQIAQAEDCWSFTDAGDKAQFARNDHDRLPRFRGGCLLSVEIDRS
jgi:hypothetical protein